MPDPRRQASAAQTTEMMEMMRDTRDLAIAQEMCNGFDIIDSSLTHPSRHFRLSRIPHRYSTPHTPARFSARAWYRVLTPGATCDPMLMCSNSKIGVHFRRERKRQKEAVRHFPAQFPPF